MGAKQEFIRLPSRGFRGLDLRSSILDKDVNSARVCSNVIKDANQRFTIRRGIQEQFNQVATYSRQALFPFNYTYFDTSTAAQVEELLAFGIAQDGVTVQTPALYKIEVGSLTITYTGSGNARLRVTREAASGDGWGADIAWRVTLTANSVSQINDTYECALNFDGSSTDDRLGDLRDAIDALADFSCSTIAAADRESSIDSLGLVDVTWTSASPATVSYQKLTTINTIEQFSGMKGFTDAEFVLPSFLTYANVAYIAYGGELYKYDGNECYQAGLPQATISAIADASGGSTFAAGEVYIYKLVYAREDARNNYLEGEDSDDTLSVATHTMSGTKDIDITINNLTDDDYPYIRPRTAKVNGAQNGVTTITVDSGHTLEAGDIAYFLDGVTSEYTEREITAVDTTEISIDGAAVNVADNILISNNVRIQIWRTTNGGTEFFLVDEIPNDALNDTQVYTDSLTDASLGEPFVEQLRKHSLPPKCSYVGTHQGLMLLAGDPTNPTRLSWNLSTPTGTEGFAIESNNTDIKTAGVGALTGFATLDANSLAVFKKNSHAVVIGELDSINFVTRDRTYSGIGCTAFSSLAYIGGDIENSALVGMSLNGPFIAINGELSLKFAEPIAALFPGTDTLQTNGTAITGTAWLTTHSLPMEPTLRRVVGFNDYNNQHYHMFIPYEIGTPGNLKGPSYLYSKWLVYDYGAEVPYWTEFAFGNRYSADDYADGVVIPVNPQNGLTIYQNELWFGSVSGRLNSKLEGLLYKFKNTGDEEDFTDGTFPIFRDIFYTPITRQADAVVAFFKPLYVILRRYLGFTDDDPLGVLTVEETLDFGVSIKAYKDRSVVVLDVEQNWDVSGEVEELCFKPVGQKCKMFQVRVSNSNALPTEVPSFDEVEIVYCTPYDKKKKDPAQ